MKKLKILSLATCCLVSALLSEIQGAEGLREIDAKSLSGLAVSKLKEFSRVDEMNLISVNNNPTLGSPESQLHDEIRCWKQEWNPGSLSDMASELSNILENRGNLNALVGNTYFSWINVIFSYYKQRVDFIAKFVEDKYINSSNFLSVENCYTIQNSMKDYLNVAISDKNYLISEYIIKEGIDQGLKQGVIRKLTKSITEEIETNIINIKLPFDEVKQIKSILENYNNGLY